MSKPCLLLIHCSNVLRRRKDKCAVSNFRPLVIHGGGRATSDLKASSWELAFQLAELGLLISNRNYIAVLQASLALVTGANSDWQRLDHEKND
jgi:hypothetical protein